MLFIVSIVLGILLMIMFYDNYFLLLCFFLYFIMKYIDGEEFRGNRYWAFIRRYTWNESVTYLMSNKASILSDSFPRRSMFVVMGNLTGFTMMSAFGLHGGVFDKLELVYTLPAILFRIPFLRDVLLWMGAVENSMDTIKRILDSGKTIAHSPNGMLDFFGMEPTDVTTTVPSDEFFQFAKDQNIKIIPVLFINEKERYNIVKLSWFQRYFYNKFGWPFPLLFFAKFLGEQRPPNVKVYIGAPIDSSKEMFLGQMESYLLPTTDNNEFLIKTF